MSDPAAPSRNETPDVGTADAVAASERRLAPAAQRALAEAASRRAQAEAAAGPAERGGPPGPEPTRYGDWERKGLAIDF